MNKAQVRQFTGKVIGKYFPDITVAMEEVQRIKS